MAGLAFINPKMPGFFYLPKPKPSYWEIHAKFGIHEVALAWREDSGAFAIRTLRGKVVGFKSKKAARRRWCRELAEAICRRKEAA